MTREEKEQNGSRRPKKDGSSAVGASPVALTDTVEQQQAQIAQLQDELADLQAKQTLLEHAADIADLGYGVWDENLNRETMVSDVMARIHGMTHSEYLEAVTSFEAYVETIIVPEDRNQYRAYEESFELDLSGRTSSLDFRIRLPNGDIKYVRQTSRFLPDSGDPPRRSVVALQDVTEMKRVEVGLRRSEELRRITARVASLGHAIWDYEEAKYLYVSEEWADIFGYGAEEFLEKFTELSADIELVHPVDRDRYLEYYHSEEGAVIEYRILRRDGEVRHVEQHYHYDEENSPSTGVVTLQDITERKMAEMNMIHSSKLATLGEMSTSLAHELNQPLNAISLAAENVTLQAELGHTDLPTSVLEKIKRIKEQVGRAASIIDHMRLFGREANEDNLRFDAREAIEGCMKIYSEQLRLSQIDVQLSVGSGPLMIEGHPIRLEQVLVNLISNSLHAMKAHKIANSHCLRITASANQEQHRATICLSDTGGGIPEEMLSRVFEPFFTTKPMSEGTGLGLSVSYGIIGEMNGELHVENRDGGACFTITLPLAQRRKAAQKID